MVRVLFNGSSQDIVEYIETGSSLEITELIFRRSVTNVDKRWQMKTRSSSLTVLKETPLVFSLASFRKCCCTAYNLTGVKKRFEVNAITLDCFGDARGAILMVRVS